MVLSIQLPGGFEIPNEGICFDESFAQQLRALGGLARRQTGGGQEVQLRNQPNVCSNPKSQGVSARGILNRAQLSNISLQTKAVVVL